jgi:hypothetical protein
VLIEVGQRGFGQSLRPRRRAHPILAGVSAFLLGGLIGSITSWLWPVRLFSPGPVRGLSVVVTPILNGILMHWYGTWRERRGSERFFLATFWGGAMFGLGVSLVRLLMIGLP